VPFGCQVKILYVRNLMLSTSEETLENIFNQAAGRCYAVERVKKIKDYAFVHFHNRDDALRALHVINGIHQAQLLSLSVSCLRYAFRQTDPLPSSLQYSSSSSLYLGQNNKPLIRLFISFETSRYGVLALLACGSTDFAPSHIRKLTHWGAAEAWAESGVHD